jgi:hypothetical protein
LKKQQENPWLLLTISLIGVLLTIGFLTRPLEPSKTENTTVIWLIFSAICILGGMATLLPHKCSPYVTLSEKLAVSRYSDFGTIRIVHGHHPVCDFFEDHEFRIREKIFCSSCMGLLTGSIISFLLATLRFIFKLKLPDIFGFISLIFIISGLFYIPLKKVKPLSRFIINSLFVIAFSFLLIVVDKQNNFFLDLIIICLSIFWMMTRIQLSRWSYDNICTSCEQECLSRNKVKE